MFSFLNIRFLVVLFIDFLISIISFNLAVFIRLGNFYSSSSYETLIAALIVPLTFFIFKIYKTSWRYFSLNDMWALIRISLVANLFIFISIFILNRLDMTPRLVIILNFFCLSVFTCASRIIYRSIYEKFFLDLNSENSDNIPVLLVGSEENADTFIRGTERKNSPYRVLGIISEKNITDKSYLIRGIPVLGNIKRSNDIINKLGKENNLPQRLVIVSNTIKGSEMSDLMKISETYGMKLGRAPLPGEIFDEDSKSLIKEISLEDLLGRRQNRLNTKFISKLINNNVVLISGAAGSIGAALSKKILSFNPSKLILLDISENSIYNLKSKFNLNNNKKIVFICSDIRNKLEMHKLFDKHRPDVIFHAGAMKHVAICEENISEAIRTNVFGTLCLSNLAEKFLSKCFVLISTDKAVDPTSVMGCTKKIAELVVKSKDKKTKKRTKFIVVRFGNVLGSTGSVVPLFKRQLSKGGPLTVTDKKATRFFMTVNEAVDLVVHASAENTFRTQMPSGCINVLNMGASVKIDDLAKQIIRLSGLIPNKDINIKYIGLSKGEKLTEQLYAKSEKIINQNSDGYFLVNEKNKDNFDINKLLKNLELICDKEHYNIREKLFKILR